MAIELTPPESRLPTTAPPTARSWARSLGTRKPTLQDRTLFTERLALLIETGMPLHVSLRTLRDQSPPGSPMRPVLDDILEQITQGAPFGHSLKRYPDLFPVSYVNLVLASEGSGFLHEVLRELVAADEKAGRLRRTLVQAVTYPAFLTVFSIGVMAFVLVVVFPKFADLFASIRNDLPWTTRLLMGASDALRLHWAAVGACAAVAAAVAARAWARPGVRAAADRLAMRTPYLREILIEIHLVRFARLMGLSIGRGVGVVDTLAACRQLTRNVVFSELMARLQSAVNEGRGLTAALRESSWLPILVSQLVATGEESGQLAHVLGRVADYYERELMRRVSTVARLTEPVMLLFTGTLVGLIVSALILPIFKLSRVVH
jgi:type II secretory pathway component PulF